MRIAARIFLMFCILLASKASAIHRQVCTFETNSPLAGGGDTNRVGYYYHQDQLTSSSVLSDSAGIRQEINAYYPFGRTQTASPQASFKVSRQFTGQVKDDETGLYYYNFRYYDAEIGRFIQADDIIPDLGNPQSYNRYSYVMNNPLRYTDPDGHGAIGDALFSQETFTSSYQLLTMHDSFGWRMVEVPLALGGMAIATADTALNVVSFGGKTALEGSAKGMIKAALKEAGKVEGEKVGSKFIKGGVETVNKGKEGVAKSEAAAAARGDIVRGKEVTFELPKGGRTRADMVTESKGDLNIVESKNGASARMTSRQTEAQEAVKQGQPLIPRGGNAQAAGITPGKPIQINKFQIDQH